MQIEILSEQSVNPEPLTLAQLNIFPQIFQAAYQGIPYGQDAGNAERYGANEAPGNKPWRLPGRVKQARLPLNENGGE